VLILCQHSTEARISAPNAALSVINTHSSTWLRYRL